MEEERGDAGSSSGVDYHASKPPTETGRSDQQGIYFTDWNSEGVGANCVSIGCCCGRLGNERNLFGRRRTIREFDFDVGLMGISQGGLGQPCEEIVGRVGGG